MHNSGPPTSFIDTLFVLTYNGHNNDRAWSKHALLNKYNNDVNEPGGPHLELEKYIGVIVHRADLKLNNYYQKVVNPFDITVDQWEILVVLWEQEGITQKELAERLHKDQTNVARMLFKLEKKGFIYRVTHESDRRSLRVFLTVKGREIKEKILAPSIEAYRKTIEGLTEEEVETFRRILAVMHDNVKDL